MEMEVEMKPETFTIIYDKIYQLLNNDNDAIRVLMYIIRVYKQSDKGTQAISISNDVICRELALKERTLQRLLDKLQNEYQVIWRFHNRYTRYIKIINKEIITLYKLNCPPSTWSIEKNKSLDTKTKQTEFYAKLNEYITNRLPPQNIREAFGNIPSKTVLFMLFFSESHYRLTSQNFLWDGLRYGIVKSLMGLTFKDRTSLYSLKSIYKTLNECLHYAPQDKLLQTVANCKGGLIESQALNVDYYKTELANLYLNKEVE